MSVQGREEGGEEKAPQRGDIPGGGAKTRHYERHSSSEPEINLGWNQAHMGGEEDRSRPDCEMTCVVS